MSKNNILKRIFALVAILATVILVQFSNEYISEHINHHCDDSDHCPVCSVIIQCENNIKTLSTGLILVVAAVIAFSFIAVEIANFDYQSIQTTLVSQKVRLDS
jgi:hypothetical protein